MIALENISTLPLIRFSTIPEDGIVNKKIIQDIKDFDLTNYELLKAHLEEKMTSSNSDSYIYKHDWSRKLIHDDEETLKTINSLNLKAEIYHLPKRNDFKGKEKEKNALDKSVDGSELIYGSPFQINNAIYKKHQANIAGFNVYELKQLLTHCDVFGNNLLREYLNIRKVDEVYNILYALSLYEEQLNRILLEEKDNDNLDISNLFKLHYDEKKELITSEIKAIADYIGDTATGFIWGSFNYIEMSYILYGAYSASEHDIARRNAFIHMLTNYTTLEEAEKGLVRTRAIDRFIKK